MFLAIGIFLKNKADMRSLFNGREIQSDTFVTMIYVIIVLIASFEMSGTSHSLWNNEFFWY